MPSSLRQHLPWRVQRALTAAYYIKPLTDYLFQSARKTPPVAADPESPLNVLSLLDHCNVNNYLIAIKSLLLHLREAPAVTVLSDGSLQPDDVACLRYHVAGIGVVTQAEVAIPSFSARVIEAWCAQYRYLAKLMYLPYVTEKPFIMILDSDVVFRRSLPSTFAQLAPGLAARYNCDHDHSRCDPCFHYLQEYAGARGIHLIPNLNCGLMLWERSQLRPLDAVEFLEYVVRQHGFLHPVAEQDAWTLLASQLQTEPLEPQFLVLSNWDYNDRPHRRNAAAIHYVSGERYRRFDYLLDGWRTMRALRSRSACPQPLAAAHVSCQRGASR
jgi:hypothetical protein